nr:hypothetical protein [uncultured Desulfuromonas sp.]
MVLNKQQLQIVNVLLKWKCSTQGMEFVLDSIDQINSDDPQVMGQLLIDKLGMNELFNELKGLGIDLPFEV